jgi:hypothetical protein
MTKSRKSLSAAIAALVVAVAVLAGPASASASVWLHEGKPLSEHVELPLGGGEVIEVGTSTLLCDTAATMTTEGGSTAEITAYNVEKASCIGLSGGVEGCEVTAATPQSLPWSVSVNSVDLTAKGAGVTYSFDAGCSIDKIETSFPELTLTPEEPAAIRLFHFHQEGTGKVDGESASLTDSGALELPEADFGKYGIG